jgi:hypothetical protein
MMYFSLDHSCQAFGRSNSNCDSCLMEIRVRTGYHIVRTVDWSFLLWNLERISDWLSSDVRPDLLLKCPDGTSWHRKLLDTVECPDGRGMSSGQMMLVSGVRTEKYFVRTNGAVDRRTSGRDATSSGRLSGNLNFFEPWHHYESGIPVYSIFYT